MSETKKTGLLVAGDIAAILFSISVCYYFRFDGVLPPDYRSQYILYCAAGAVLGVASMAAFKLYRKAWRYASTAELKAIVQAVAVGCLLSWTCAYLLSGRPVPLSIAAVSFQSMLLGMGCMRFYRRLRADPREAVHYGRRRALIVGAGSCGLMVARKLQGSPDAELTPVAFIDDDPGKRRMEIGGLPVAGGREAIADAVRDFVADEIIIAMPSAPRKEVSAIIDLCKRTKASLKIIPRIDDLIHGKLQISEIRHVEVEDLLGREPVQVDLEGIAGYVRDKTVLVTGAGGSIGSELCRQIAPFRPQRLLLLGHGENSIYAIDMELRRRFPDLPIEPIIADVQDAARLDDVFSRFMPQVVFHAAAHKHVPLMESNPAEAIKNNVFGTKNAAECADRYRTERFVLVSTDKAVNPTSVMGATKRIAEMVVQSMNRQSSTIFAAVRFGNVLGSRGSVIPRFKQQIADGGPVTVTHPEMIRYFMTIPEAAQLVVQAGALAEGGEVFVLDMGEPVRILDLAEDLIRLSGFEPYRDVDIVFSGIRPGEKLYEELLTGEEGLTATRHDRIFIGKPSNVSWSQLELSIKRMERVFGEGQIKELIKRLVPTYMNVS